MRIYTQLHTLPHALHTTLIGRPASLPTSLGGSRLHALTLTPHDNNNDNDSNYEQATDTHTDTYPNLAASPALAAAACVGGDGGGAASGGGGAIRVCPLYCPDCRLLVGVARDRRLPALERCVIEPHARAAAGAAVARLVVLAGREALGGGAGINEEHAGDLSRVFAIVG